MATSDDIFRINPIIRELARLLFAHVNRELPEAKAWASAFLDVRFDEQGGFAYKIRVTHTNGEVVSLCLPTDVTLQLIELNTVRPTGKDRWYAFKLELTASGACEVNFNYDTACTDDPSFFTS
jgi:hypothetical protein